MATIKGWHASLIVDKIKRTFDEKGYVFLTEIFHGTLTLWA